MHLSPLAFLFAVNLLLLVFGIFIEPLPGIVVLVPILAPIAHALGINDLQFGIVVIVNLTMGMITPPVGGLLFVTSIVATRAARAPRRASCGRSCGRSSACWRCCRSFPALSRGCRACSATDKKCRRSNL